MHADAPRSLRPRWTTFLVAAACAAASVLGCADLAPEPRAREGAAAIASAVPRVSATAVAAALPELGFELVPDAGLQALIDPPDRWRGPTWFGGDIASSIEIGRRRYVWLFGDTLVALPGAACRAAPGGCARRAGAPSDVVGNSAGVMEVGPDGRPRPIVKYWRSSAGGPAPILAETEPEEILWPLAGARVGEKLLLAVSRHTRAGGLAPLGNLFALVQNPDDRPDRWRYDLHPVPNVRAAEGEPDPLTWTTALVVEGPHVHVFGMRGPALTARTVLMRLRVEDVAGADWEPRPEYLLDGDGETEGSPVWSDRFALERLHALVGLPGTTEASFEWSADLGWVTFQIPPFGFHIRAYTAPALAGPWSDRGVVYRIPPPWSTELRADCHSPEIGCGWERFAAYAAKSHPELAPPGGFAVSYNVNLLFGTLETAIEAAQTLDGFYVPQMLAGAAPPR